MQKLCDKRRGMTGAAESESKSTAADFCTGCRGTAGDGHSVKDRLLPKKMLICVAKLLLV
jgi:hypothetical protein